jgi:hypothetical protein
MTDAPHTPSESTFALIRRLHPMTRFLILVALLHLAATLVEAMIQLTHPSAAWAAVSLGQQLAVQVRAVTYSLTLLGGAASVEFLFRIWDELKRARKA